MHGELACNGAPTHTAEAQPAILPSPTIVQRLTPTLPLLTKCMQWLKT